MSRERGRVERLLAAAGRIRASAVILPDDALTDPDPDSGERWDRGQALAHVAEMLPYWAQQAELVAAGRQAEFGRVKSDPDRIAAIERDRREDPARLLARVDEGVAVVLALLERLDDRGLAAVGHHQTLGDMTVGRDDRPVPGRPPGGARRPAGSARPRLTLREQPAQAYQGPMTDLVYDVTEATFEAEVLEKSKTVPVLVDFWADWCGPCHALAPVLERAVERQGGEVVLARVDVDQNQRLAAAFQVQGIPAVKAFAGGRLVDEFVGAQPAQVVERFVESLLPSEADRAAAAAAELDPAEAAARWREVLEQDPDNLAARAGLADLALREGRPAEAIELLRPIEHDPEVAVLLASARLAAEAADPASRFAPAAAQAADGQADPALATLLDAVREGPGETRDKARELMLDVFRLLGDDHPLTTRYRRDLTRALF